MEYLRLCFSLGLLKRSWALFFLTCLSVLSCSQPIETQRPNVVLIMTDDQGYGDLGAHGNSMIRTPNLDTLYSESVRMTQFYVSPVCAPTRASLMTGRYNYRTGVVDTWVGRAMMESDEVTLAEILSDAGYKTGIFGKWHLGDTWPMRPIDQGFQESLVHKGGGIGQPSDPPSNTYFDSVLSHNGKWVKREGYCTDVFTDASIEFIEKNRDEPFFIYLATNAPHTPLQVDESYVAHYRELDLKDDEVALPEERSFDPNTTSRIYGMVENIDENIGRLLNKLSELGLEEDTLVIFMTDNGPQQWRYNAGLRGRKTQVWEGGIHVPFFIRWPSELEGGREVDRIAAHIDVLPTVLEACRVDLPTGLKIDGRSLMPLLRGLVEEWPDRTLFLQSHRGDEPQPFRNFAARNQRYKIVQPVQFSGPPITGRPHISLFDMVEDPGESTDLSADKPEILQRLVEEYENWFADVSSTRGYDPVRIPLGSADANRVTLTPQDWRGAEEYHEGNVGYYAVTVLESGNYRLRLSFAPPAESAIVHLKIGERSWETEVTAIERLGSPLMVWTSDPIDLGQGDTRIEAWISQDEQPDVGARYIEVTKM